MGPQHETPLGTSAYILVLPSSPALIAPRWCFSEGQCEASGAEVGSGTGPVRSDFTQNQTTSSLECGVCPETAANSRGGACDVVVGVTQEGSAP